MAIKKSKLTATKAKLVSFVLLKKRQKVKAPRVKRISWANLSKLVRDITADPFITFSKDPVMEISPRHPYDPLGLMDVYKPGRWDCTSNLLFMETIVTGGSPGVWDGTVVYANFKATQAGAYLIVGNFSGYQITMQLHGPWGNNTAYTATTSDRGAVIALWTASAANQSVYFTMNCITGNNQLGMGYLESIQVFML